MRGRLVLWFIGGAVVCLHQEERGWLFHFWYGKSELTGFCIFNVFKSIAVTLWSSGSGVCGGRSPFSGSRALRWLQCLVATLLWGFEDLRERSDWLYVCPRTVLSTLFSESFFSGNWYLETTICMFGAFIIAAFSLFLRCFQWTELGNTF